MMHQDEIEQVVANYRATFHDDVEVLLYHAISAISAFSVMYWKLDIDNKEDRACAKNWKPGINNKEDRAGAKNLYLQVSACDEIVKQYNILSGTAKVLALARLRMIETMKEYDDRKRKLVRKNGKRA